MKKRKYLTLTAASVLLIALLAAAMLHQARTSVGSTADRIRFALSGRSAQETIKPWYDELAGQFFLILPPYADPGALSIQLSHADAAVIDGRRYRHGDQLTALALDTPYSFALNGVTSTLTLLQTDPIPSMYIETRTGHLDHIHDHKGIKEEVALLLLDASGSTVYRRTDMQDQIALRGNTSSEAPKKPYTITLKDAAPLLPCGAAKKWVLLANAMEGSNLRNKLVYDFASELGMPFSPHCEYTHLYINGQYLGLYLLADKTEVGTNRIELDEDRGALITANQSAKWDHVQNGFVTQVHEFEIVKKDEVLRSYRNRIADRINTIEALIFAGSTDELLTMIDLDSWVRRYLIDEVFLNPDAERASSYYYWLDLENSPLYAGPIWDYDYALSTRGKYRDASSMLIGQPIGYPWLAALMQMPVFRQRAEELFETEFLPLASAYAETQIAELYAGISRTARINRMIWPDCSRLQTDPDAEALLLQQFLKDRLDFLQDYLLRHEPYCFVTFEQAESFFNMSYALKTGTALGGSIDEWVHYPELYDSWYDAETGEIFDPDQPVTCDLLIVPKLTEQTASDQSMDKLMKYVPALAVCVIFGILTLILMALTMRQLWRKGGGHKP